MKTHDILAAICTGVLNRNKARGTQRIKAFVAAVVLCIPSSFAAQAADLPPVTLASFTPLPGFVGDFDHFAVDLKRNHLLLAAEEHHTLEVFDLKTGKHLHSVSGLKAPHTLAYVPEKDELFITDGDAAACVILSGGDFHETGRIPVRPGADAALYDPVSKIFYVANGGREEKAANSSITEISVMDHKVVAQIAIDGDNVEAMAIDHANNRMFVNIRDKKQVGVVDLASRQIVARWTAPGMNRNTTLTFDPVTKRVFVAGRSPGKFVVFNAADGRVVAATDCVNNADGMTWDPATRRIYITGSQGLSIFRQDGPDKYYDLTQIPTNGGKTSLYVPEVKQLYIVHPKTEIDDAALLIYKVNS
jgi:DNA-binding beta-propeller fold protein YncE